MLLLCNTSPTHIDLLWRALLTARERAKLGPVVMINPFNVFAKERRYLRSDGFNPLGALDPKSDDFNDDCAGIAEALVKEQVGKDGAFFTSSAQDLLTALIMHETPRAKSKRTVHNVDHWFAWWQNLERECVLVLVVLNISDTSFVIASPAN